MITFSYSSNLTKLCYQAIRAERGAMYYAKLTIDSSLDAFKVEIYSRKTGEKVKSFYSLTLLDVKDFLDKYFAPVHGRTKSAIIERYK